ncbi:uncharacterized protein HD556DRAFT_1258978 [Suillus plorans]|uniref:Protein kinase domain-containing protein n=1 Tax=Suillus plorans TaxID=116603 RepID=A0A9P7J928_9AGAM|nr:uncharacterized protein HD556DRAFT_1258978 [Suillus plorans]KAG1809761.1 hypothetical protein HD556DRAFT_1258978 [Suillus plorans]
MATPHTPRSQKSQVLPPDTPLGPRHTLQSDYFTGDLELGREAVLTDLRRYLQVPFVSLAKCVGAVPSQQLLEEMRDNLIRSDILTDDGLKWKDFRPAKMSEEMTFKLEAIISGILEQVPNCGVSYLSNPNKMPLSERLNTSLPDGYLVRANNRTSPRMHWFDIAVPFEFKKKQDAKALRDNEHKIIWSLHNIMREDPCRRFAFGITIEDTQLRLWLGNRGFLAVTEPINCFEDIDGVISLFYALGSASTSTSLKGLGWDPTVERIDVGEKTQYKFTVGDEVFTTTRELATYGADSMVGRGTRVYEATDAKGKKVAIKDSWREIDRQSEGEIVENILASCEKKLGAEDFADAKRHFIGVRLWKDVTIDGASDETVNPMAGGEHNDTWKREPINPKPILFERTHLSATAPGDVPDSGKLSAQLGIVRGKDCRIPQRVHARIVFDDVGVAIKDVVSLADNLSCLSGALKALSYLHKAGWIHRDFSVGNVSWVVGDNGGIGKLGDFEYAKEIDTSHDDVRTGTMHFMAIEVERQQYFFRPRGPTPSGRTLRAADLPPPPPFRMNFLHDIESVWWAYTWIFFYHTDTIKANASDSFDVHAQWRQFQLAFPGAICQGSRQNFFTRIQRLQSTCKSILSDRCYNVCNNIPQFAQTLQDSYETAESKYPFLALDDSLREDMHRKAAGYLDDAQQSAGDIKLCPLPKLLEQKRPREEGETSDNAGKRIRHG